MKNNPLVFLLHILALPSASHLACYQPLLWTQVATTSGSLTNWNLWLWSCSDSRPTVGASWCWKAKKDHVNVFFFPTVQTGVCKTTQFMPWVPFHQPSHQCQAKLPLPGERKSSEWVKQGSGHPWLCVSPRDASMSLQFHPQQNKGVPKHSCDQGRLSCPTPGSSTSDKVRQCHPQQGHRTMVPKPAPSATASQTQQRVPPHRGAWRKKSWTWTFQSWSISSHAPLAIPVVYLFAAQHHKHFYQLANFKSNCFLHEVKPSVHNALSHADPVGAEPVPASACRGQSFVSHWRVRESAELSSCEVKLL